MKVTRSWQVVTRLSFSFTQNDQRIDSGIRRYRLSRLLKKTPSFVRSFVSGEKRSSHSLPEMFRLLCLFTWIRWPPVSIALVSFPLPLIMWPMDISNRLISSTNVLGIDRHLESNDDEQCGERESLSNDSPEPWIRLIDAVHRRASGSLQRGEQFRRSSSPIPLRITVNWSWRIPLIWDLTDRSFAVPCDPDEG